MKRLKKNPLIVLTIITILIQLSCDTKVDDSVKYDEIKNTLYKNLGRIIHDLAHGALMGARGNSGVILSQLWRGFARSLGDKDILDGISFSNAMAEARDTAYKGVVRPVEGTILTVAKDMASAAENALQVTNDPYENGRLEWLTSIIGTQSGNSYSMRIDAASGDVIEIQDTSLLQ